MEQIMNAKTRHLLAIALLAAASGVSAAQINCEYGNPTVCEAIPNDETTYEWSFTPPATPSGTCYTDSPICQVQCVMTGTGYIHVTIKDDLGVVVGTASQGVPCG
jgi:hypothetical protein